MHSKKKHKTLDDIPVSKLLNDFVRYNANISEKTAQDIDDEAYIKMMLRKQIQRKVERARRESISTEGKRPLYTQKDALDEAIQRRYFPYMDEETTERKIPADDDIVNEIMNSLTANDVSELATKMREAVDFVQEELGESESERKMVEALERFQERIDSEKNARPHITNDNVLVLKRCQNCHFCLGEETLKGKVWCLCNNPNRTREIETDGSWVKNSINLPCWRQSED